MFKHFKRYDTELRWDFRASCFTSYNAASRTRELLPNAPILIDLGRAQRGWERLAKGKPVNKVVDFINQEMPAQPSFEHEMIGLIPIMHGELGRCIVVVDNDRIAEAFTALYEVCQQEEQYAAGLLPAVQWAAGRFEIIEWIERNEAQLGPRMVP